MKNKITILLLSLFFFQTLSAENLNIKSKNITLDKNSKITIFKDGVEAIDENKNILKTNYAEYNKDLKYLKSEGKTSIITSEGYNISGRNIIFDNSNKLIKSDYPAKIIDLENNEIFLERFEYSTKNNFFKSAGNIKVLDSKNNSYAFSQIYIDEKKREIAGTDIKVFLNQESFKVNKANKPRIFANAVKINEKNKDFTKSVFTLCDYRENDKCPPWSLQASKMSHDKIKKSIYYDNAIIKIYDVPIFYFPKLSHPDPTVSRRSGFLPPSFSDSKNLGSGLEIPYFWALSTDKDFTITNKLFASENPLFLGEYRQAFKSSNLIFDFGYTSGYKNTTSTKKPGDKSHFFSKFVKNFRGKNNSDNNFELSFQNVSHDKYLKLYNINTSLVDQETDTLNNSINFNHENENLFVGLQASVYETLKEGYNDKHEYILPEITVDKNLVSSLKYGNVDFQSNLKVHNYDTNKFKNFFINDFDWKYKSFNFLSGVKGSLLGKFKNVNYETRNVSEYKDKPSSEFYGALGYLTELNLYKRKNDNTEHLLTPKILFRYAPDHMRKESDGSRLSHLNVFSLDRLSSADNFESGASATLGFEYEVKDSNQEFDFTLAQVINEKENKQMPNSSSLNEKLSDIVGQSNFKINDNVKLDYTFALDQNYNDFNYNEIGTSLDFNPIKFDFNYLREREHIGDQEYFSAKAEFKKGNNGLFKFENKRNLITDSSEYYNLSYEYLNDCLRAGLVYRREFYNDSELESENSLMFKITLIPFGNINSPSFNK